MSDKRNNVSLLLAWRVGICFFFSHSALVHGWATRRMRQTQGAEAEAAGAAEADGEAAGADVNSEAVWLE
jgi:hypothetical protein